MVDIIRETPMRVADVQERFRVARSTVEGWFRAGLESGTMGGVVITTAEALQRFFRPRSFAVVDSQGNQTTAASDADLRAEYERVRGPRKRRSVHGNENQAAHVA